MGSLYGMALSAQRPSRPDTLKAKMPDSVTIIAALQQPALQSLSVLEGTYMYAAKKTGVIQPDRLDINRSDNNPRQIFAKVPGVFVYEHDSTGNQVNIATRGLTAHRSWEMNVRHNDVMTNSDLNGYPAKYNVKLALNNLFDKQYFTERPPFFPGPGGLYPSDGRSLIFSVGATL